MTRRRELPTVPTPANWHSVSVNRLVVYREPQDDSYTETVMVDNHNPATGQTEYTDGSGKGWYTPGEQPEGWTAVQVQGSQLVARVKRGEVSGISITEADTDNKPIPRDTEGYAEFLSFNMNELRELAENNPATVGAAYQTAVGALQALAGAIYDTVNS